MILLWWVILSHRYYYCMLFDVHAGVHDLFKRWLLYLQDQVVDGLGSYLSGCLMQLAKYTLHSHCLFSLSATRVTTLWLKQPICFRYAFTDCHMTGSCMSHDCHVLHTLTCCTRRSMTFSTSTFFSASSSIVSMSASTSLRYQFTSSPLLMPPSSVCVWEEREGRDKERRGRRRVYMEGTAHN